MKNIAALEGSLVKVKKKSYHNFKNNEICTIVKVNTLEPILRSITSNMIQYIDWEDIIFINKFEKLKIL